MADKPTLDDPRIGSFRKTFRWEPSWEFLDFYIRTQAGDKGTKIGAISAIAAEVIHSWRGRFGGAVVSARRAAEAAYDYDEASTQDVPIIQMLIQWAKSEHKLTALEVITAIHQECLARRLPPP